mmetsp:Transcript_65421/g.191909  ORF Transcript_65421/g.191909 Transcript_65421/m.191909 type:complete len:273 (+) Transcript_65421:534-1352(+)
MALTSCLILSNFWSYCLQRASSLEKSSLPWMAFTAAAGASCAAVSASFTLACRDAPSSVWRSSASRVLSWPWRALSSICLTFSSKRSIRSSMGLKPAAMPDIRCWSRFSKPDSAMEQAAVPSSTSARAHSRSSARPRREASLRLCRSCVAAFAKVTCSRSSCWICRITPSIAAALSFSASFVELGHSSLSRAFSSSRTCSRSARSSARSADSTRPTSDSSSSFRDSRSAARRRPSLGGSSAQGIRLAMSGRRRPRPEPDVPTPGLPDSLWAA